MSYSSNLRQVSLSSYSLLCKTLPKFQFLSGKIGSINWQDVEQIAKCKVSKVPPYCQPFVVFFLFFILRR